MLIQGDCLKVLPELPDESVDLVVSSPPYNIGIDYGVYKDNLSFQEYFDFMKKALAEIYRILKPDGRVAWNVLIEVNKPFRYSPFAEFYKLFLNVGFNYFGTILWLDETRVKLTAWGSFASPSQPYIYTPHEVILLFYKDSPKKLSNKEKDIKENEFVDWARGTWKIKPENNPLTPCAFPVELPKRLIKLLTYKTDTVLDPFLGSGTTMKACLELNRNCIGIEINPEYVKVAKKRLNWGSSLGDVEFEFYTEEEFLKKVDKFHIYHIEER